MEQAYIWKVMTLKKEIEEGTNKWKLIPYSWIGRIKIIKMSMLPKTIFSFKAIPIKSPMMCLTELEQYSKNLHGNIKDPK